MLATYHGRDQVAASGPLGHGGVTALEEENTFTMEQFAASVNEFLSFRRFQILPDHNKGLVSHEDAVRKAEEDCL